MRGKIDVHGGLCIERAGVMWEQNCPRDHLDIRFEPIRCSQSCPLFGEPDKAYIGERSVVRFEICEGRALIFDHFTDERKET